MEAVFRRNRVGDRADDTALLLQVVERVADLAEESPLFLELLDGLLALERDLFLFRQADIVLRQRVEAPDLEIDVRDLIADFFRLLLPPDEERDGGRDRRDRGPDA